MATSILSSTSSGSTDSSGDSCRYRSSSSSVALDLNREDHGGSSGATHSMLLDHHAGPATSAYGASRRVDLMDDEDDDEDEDASLAGISHHHLSSSPLASPPPVEASRRPRAHQRCLALCRTGGGGDITNQCHVVRFRRWIPTPYGGRTSKRASAVDIRLLGQGLSECSKV
nr:uncharacterized protein LOC119168362 [Rhipicephalus microplus]